VRIVVGLGGHALLRRDEEPTASNQLANIASSAAILAPLAREHSMVLTHGNGPQIGLLALREAAVAPESAQPLDVLGAQTEGLIGHLLAQEFRTHVPGIELAVVLTQVRVDPDDPAFSGATKPIGPTYDEVEARRLERTRGWEIVRDAAGWRRAVASPAPLELLELSSIRLLCAAGTLVICAGGGGIPVARDANGRVRGLEAVVDKDATSALLAESLDAELLLLLTDVDALYRDFGTPDARAIDRIEAGQALALADELPEGSIGPKLRAAAAFVASTGAEAAIGTLDDAEALLAGGCGTRIVPDTQAPESA
jgi:carbamate kinase